MKLIRWVGLYLVVVASPAFASFHFWVDQEFYASGNGQVQFVELFTASGGQEFLNGQTLRSVSADGLQTNNYTFPSNSLSGTAGKTLLIATRGFSQLPGGVSADFALTNANGFLFPNGGTVNLVGAGGCTETYGPGGLPLNGKDSLNTNPGPVTNSATPKNFAGTTGSINIPDAGSQKVFFEGLYHNNTNLNSQTEIVPLNVASTNRFLELDYVANRAEFYYLTASPAGDGDVSTRVRLYPVGDNGNFEDFADGELVATISLATTNPFHATPAAGVVTVDVWRARWTPPANYTGTVYYVPQVRVSNGGNVTDSKYLLTSIGGNAGNTNYGANNFFWQTNAQSFGVDFNALDYSFAWTNKRSPTYDFFYFNSSNNPTPQSETVPGLTDTFLQYNYDSTNASYAYLLAPRGELVSMQTRFFFVNGGGEVFRGGGFLTNVVIASGTPFHTLPGSGALTLEVWRTAFYPPAGWSNESVFYAHQIQTLRNGTTWLATDLNGIATGVGVTNNWVSPQFLWSDGPFGHDWGFAPTGGIARTSLQRDYLYHNNTNLNPLVEVIPDTSGTNFVEANYASTTTTFYVITESPLNLVPGEGVALELRTSYTTNGVDYITQFSPMVFDRNLFLTNNEFHGLTAGETNQLDLWRCDWPQPLDGLGQPNTNAITVFYSPLLKTTLNGYQTDYTYLIAKINAGGPGYGTNNYTVLPQLFGPDANNQDYFYINQYVLVPGADADGDGIPDAWEQQYFGTTTNGATGDNDVDGLDNLGEYIADTVPTNAGSFFGVITNLARLPGSALNLLVNPSSTARVYDAYYSTNLVNGQSWISSGFAVPGNGGELQLTVTNTPPLLYYRTGVRLP